MRNVGYLLRWSVLLPLLVSAPSFSQKIESDNDYYVKSAYLYDFARMTRWPSSELPEGSTLMVCVYGGDEGFLKVLRAKAPAKPVNDHRVEVRRVESPREFKPCHVLFVRNSANDVEGAIAELQSAGVLLVGEERDFLNRGGMINFVSQEQRIGYQINSAAIARARLKFERQITGDSDSNTVPDQDARAVKLPVTPVYPEIARRMNVIGSVRLVAVVRADGSVKEVHVVGGHPLLAEAALRAVRQWHYQPASRETTEEVKINFGN